MAYLPPLLSALGLMRALVIAAVGLCATHQVAAAPAAASPPQSSQQLEEIDAARQQLVSLQTALNQAVQQAQARNGAELADLKQRQALAERFVFSSPSRAELDQGKPAHNAKRLAGYRRLIEQYNLIEPSLAAEKRAELTRTDSKMYYQMRVRSALPPKALKAYGLMELARQERDQGKFKEALARWEQAETLVRESFNDHIAAMAKWREDALKDAAAQQEKSRQQVEAWLQAAMVAIPSGEFLMGASSANNQGARAAGQAESSDETPAHPVKVAAFSLSKTEVTFALYDLCVASSSCYYVPPDEGWGRGNRPVINLSYQDISQQFLPWLNQLTGRSYRLPSEAEWEYAARAGTSSEYGWGQNASCDQARFDGGAASPCWAKEGKNRGSLPVQSFKANGFGLFDMHGNVWEWVEDCWHPNYQGAPADGSPWLADNCAIRVLRGGAWDYPASAMRAANRYYFSQTTRRSNYGFRLAISAKP